MRAKKNIWEKKKTIARVSGEVNESAEKKTYMDTFFVSWNERFFLKIGNNPMRALSRKVNMFFSAALI